VKLWFLRLSGWPVFLAVVGVVAGFMLAASVILTKLGNRSVVLALVFATCVLLLVTLLGVLLMTVASRG